MSLRDECRNFQHLVVFCAQNRLGRVGYFVKDMKNWDRLLSIINRFYETDCVDTFEEQRLIIYTDCSRQSVEELENIFISCDWF